MRSLTEQVRAHERHLRALELRKAGVTYETIAGQLGYANASGARKAVASALKATLREPAEELRTLELARLDAMALALWCRVQDGDEKAIDRVLRIMERRARLLGLDAAAKTELSSAGGGPLALAIVARQARERLAAKLEAISEARGQAEGQGARASAAEEQHG
jgi:hypothetical protein